MSVRAQHENLLRSLVGVEDGDIDIAGAALALAALDHPEVPLAGYRRHLAEIAATTAQAVAGASGLGAKVGALSAALAERFTYRGGVEDYEDMQNADLIRVIDRRTGLPVALGILYLHAARAQGWHGGGLNFPNHFLIQLEVDGDRAILDPFNGGQALDAGGLGALLRQVAGDGATLDPRSLERVGDRAVLIRLLNNIKGRALGADDVVRAVEIVERTLLFAPDHVPSWRDLAVLEARLGNLHSAMTAARAYDARANLDHEHKEANALLRAITSRLN